LPNPPIFFSLQNINYLFVATLVYNNHFNNLLSVDALTKFYISQEKKREMVASAFGEDRSGSRQTRLTVEDLNYLFMV
jgi:hypothetical protein